VNRLWVLRVADGQEVAVTDGTTGEWSPAWSADERTLYFLSNRGGSVDLWQQRMTAEGEPDGDARPLTVGVGMQYAAWSPDSRRLAYSKGRAVANVWRVPILADREASWDDAEQLTKDEALVGALDLHPDEGRLVISSDRAGNRDLWLVALDGSEMRQLTNDRGPEAAPRVSPDGRQIAFHTQRQGNIDVWVQPIDGGPATQLTHDPGSHMSPAWSTDGRSIAFYGGREDGVNAFVVSATGGEARQVTTGNVSKYHPQWSPDGRWIYFASGDVGSSRRIFRVPEAGGTPEQVLTRGAVEYYRWSPDGIRMYFPGNNRGSDDLWEMTLSDGRERRLTRFMQRAGTLGRTALAASRTHLYFTWRQDVGDIWTMDVASDREP
jgi:TolB protein